MGVLTTWPPTSLGKRTSHVLRTLCGGEANGASLAESIVHGQG